MSANMEQTFQIKGMDCASCARTVESGVAKLNGVAHCELNFTTEILRVQGDVTAENIVRRVQELGYEVVDDTAVVNTAVTTHPSFFQYMRGRRDTRMALLAVLLVLPGLIFHELLPGLGIESPLVDITSVLAMLIAGYPVVQSAYRAVRFNREININVLMTIAAVGAVLIGAYTEAAVVMVLFVIGEAMEGYTAERARGSIRGLMSVAPNEATLLHEDREMSVKIAELQIGDRILVKPGERIAMDGRILSGASSVNQAPITGESRLVEKNAGDEVFASSINGEGTLEVEVTHLAADNTIARVIKMVEEAQEKRAPTQRFIDKFATYYTPAVVFLAILVAVIPTVFLGQELVNAADPTAGWLYRALALLVVACPCALVISTPVSIVSAISNGAKNGVLFKGGAYLETLARVQAIAFDKTGTLTQGKPAVVRYQSAACALPADEPCADCADLLALATAVEQRSEHPIAHAVVAEATQRGLQMTYPAAQDVTAFSGRGVTGDVNGRAVTIGSHTYFDQNIPHGAHCAEVANADAAGLTTMLVSQGDNYIGYIAVADTVRESSRQAVEQLHNVGVNHLVMLTGDNEGTAVSVAQTVGVTEIRANLLPEDKVTAVADLQAKYGLVAMVGDGINDTPALATADVGIAIGSTAQAMETADVTIMRNSLLPLPFAIKLSRATMRTIKVNVALSLGIKFIFLILVLLGVGTMWMAVLADVGVSLLVTANGMRLLKAPKMEPRLETGD